MSSLSSTFLLGFYGMHFRALPLLSDIPSGSPLIMPLLIPAPQMSGFLRQGFFFLSLPCLPQRSLSCPPADTSDDHLYDRDSKIHIPRLQCHIFVALPYWLLVISLLVTLVA